jgi:hypothetical protein
MRSDLLTILDSYWAEHLQCPAHYIRSNQTIVLTDSTRHGGTVWLIGKTCLIAASPHLAQVLKSSVGSRAAMQAFEPSRLKSATAHLGINVSSPESVLALGLSTDRIAWIDPNQLHDLNGFDGIGLVSLSLRQHTERKVAETRGFELYASVIDLGERVRP